MRILSGSDTGAQVSDEPPTDLPLTCPDPNSPAWVLAYRVAWVAFPALLALVAWVVRQLS
jgi:hypothetical protein